MAMQILSHTPTWVFFLFAALAWFGAMQLVTRRVGLGRIVGIAVGMGAFGAFGVLTAFPASPVALPPALLAGAMTAALVMRLPPAAGTQYDASRRRFVVPGSAVPLALMMGLFAIKYAVGVALALEPGLRTLPPFMLGVSLLYGIFAGTFAGRALRLVVLARASGALRSA